MKQQITFYDIVETLPKEGCEVHTSHHVALPCLNDINSTTVIKSRQIALKYAEQFVDKYGQSMWFKLGDDDENIFDANVVRYYPANNRKFNSRKKPRK